MSLAVPRAGLRVTRGAVNFWSRPTDSGRRIRCAFCPDCGSRLWHETEGEQELITIKAGSLDQPVDASAAIHIWTSRKLLAVIIPKGAKQFSMEPE